MGGQPKNTSKPAGTTRAHRPTIGLFTVEIGSDWARWPWQGAVNAARERDVNLVTFAGDIINFGSLEAQANVIYDLARDGRLDGLIIWKGGLTMCLNETEIERLCGQYEIPVVTMEGRVRGFPCVSYDNYGGARRAAEHLIDEHGYRRIGFLGMYENHEGFEERFRGYADVMKEHGYAVDPRLARSSFPRDEIWDSMIDGYVLTEYLDQAAGLNVEAIMGVTDTIALQVQRALIARGSPKSKNTAVIGFDNFIDSRIESPPLTTVRPDWNDFGRQAVTVLLARLAGESVPDLITVSADLVVRQSCGCRDACVRAEEGTPPACVPDIIRQATETIRALLSEEAAGGTPGEFLSRIEEIILKSTGSMDEITHWHYAISALRHTTAGGPKERERADVLLRQAHILVSRIAERTQTARMFAYSRFEKEIHRAGRFFITALDLPVLAERVAQTLPPLGVPGCYIALFENPVPYVYPEPAPGRLRLVLASRPHSSTAPDMEHSFYPTHRIIPDAYWPADRAASFVLMSLNMVSEQIGIVLFETGSTEGMLYETLRLQISSALHAALLVNRVREHSSGLTAAVKELEAFSYSISHDLRAPLRALDGFSRILIEDFGPTIPAQALHHLTTIRENSRHMGHLIDVLLDFSRLSRRAMRKRGIDTTALVKQALADLAGEQQGRRVAITLHDLPPCRADPELLRQVWVNLLSNALKYTRQREEARIEIGWRDENGTTVFFVRDNGAGFNMRYADKLFGVFQRLHRTEDYEGTGAGLAIVHRIITRHGGKVWAEAQVDKGATFFFTVE